VAAYNTILLDAECPRCHERGAIEAQTHIASSFDGDATGRFCQRVYRVGQRMAWWPEDDLRFEAWAENADPSRPDVVTEACYATCRHCGSELYAVVEFDALAVKAVPDLGLERDWPTKLKT